MEMETSTMPPELPRLTAEEDALASQVLEIIGGISLEALQTLEEPEERVEWPMEEGDDSVFYSDEDQVHQDGKANTSCGFGADKCEQLVNSVATGEDDTGEEISIIDEEIADLEKEVTQQVILNEQEQKELQTPKTEPMDQSDPADSGATSDPTPEMSVSACGGSLKCTDADMQTQLNISAEQGNLPAEKEEVTPNLESSDVTNKETDTRLSVEADVSERVSSAELQITGDKQLRVDQDPQQDHNFHAPMGFHQNPSPGYSTLPLPKRSRGSADPQKSFNHLSSSKYSTVSYRKIRRGNTRQKIEAFEYMIMNL